MLRIFNKMERGINMAFLNKLKELKDKAVETTANTTQKVKDNYEKMKVEQAEKKAICRSI